MMFRIGVDVGGTYTDLVATDESGRTVFAKSPSTPADQSLGVMAGLDELARRWLPEHAMRVASVIVFAALGALAFSGIEI